MNLYTFKNHALHPGIQVTSRGRDAEVENLGVSLLDFYAELRNQEFSGESDWHKARVEFLEDYYGNFPFAKKIGETHLGSVLCVVHLELLAFQEQESPLFFEDAIQIYPAAVRSCRIPSPRSGTRAPKLVEIFDLGSITVSDADGQRAYKLTNNFGDLKLQRLQPHGPWKQEGDRFLALLDETAVLSICPDYYNGRNDSIEAQLYIQAHDGWKWLDTEEIKLDARWVDGLSYTHRNNFMRTELCADLRCARELMRRAETMFAGRLRQIGHLAQQP